MLRERLDDGDEDAIAVAGTDLSSAGSARTKAREGWPIP